jgi:mono/diheme cytochrome c family protein
MAEVVAHSTQHLSDDDLMAIAIYLKSLSPSIDSIATNVDDPIRNGAAIYSEYCSTCHGSDGSGYLNVIPALSGNATIIAKDPRSGVRVILHGAESPASSPDQVARLMPAYAWQLSNQQMAELMTFMRSRWGNDAEPVKASDIEKLR